MIKEKELRLETGLGGIFQEAAAFSRSSVMHGLIGDYRSKVKELGLNTKVYVDNLKIGGIVGGQIVSVIVLRHPDHLKDYEYLVINPVFLGNQYKLEYYTGGKSLLRRKFSAQENAGLAGQIFHALSNKKAAWNQEQDYYELLGKVAGYTYHR